MCREAIQQQPPLPASVEVRSAYKKYNSSAIVLRGVSLTVRRNTMYAFLNLIHYCELKLFVLILKAFFLGDRRLLLINNYYFAC